MKRERRKAILGAMGLFALFGAMAKTFSGIHWIHEIGHAIFTTLTGGTVTKITASFTHATGPLTHLGIYGGALMSMAFWTILGTYLIRSRRHLVMTGFGFGIVIAEWGWFWVSSDYNMMLPEGRMLYGIVHFGVAWILGFVAIKLIAPAIRRWDREDTHHMDNPSLFRRGEVSRL